MFYHVGLGSCWENFGNTMAIDPQSPCSLVSLAVIVENVDP